MSSKKTAWFPYSCLSSDLKKDTKNIFSNEEVYSESRQANEAYTAPSLLTPAWDPSALLISKSSK